ncbi:MAG: hypothetical protein KAI47_13370 [Deltaproteobacteria bacterium]|nr:hypothetical protein [Deltaproteobacteria bacterium]
MNRMLLVSVVVACVLSLLAMKTDADIRQSPHNFATKGGDLDRFGKRRICVYCHTPHPAKASAPRWNKEDRGRVYVKYWSPTLDAYPAGGAPPIDGVSRLCLSCHDGTVASARGLGSSSRSLRRSRRRRGIDLTGSHPISFRVTESLIAKNNAHDSPLKSLSEMKSDPDVKLDIHDKIQCTTCHDPHDNKNAASSGVPMYRKPTWEGVCLTCHLY